MKKNEGFTLVEVIVVLVSLSLVTMFFWTILSSSSEDAYTISEKIEVQSITTALMNIIQEDIQEAKIFQTEDGETIIEKENGVYTFGNGITYSFDITKHEVIRTEGEDVETYKYIATFSISSVKNDNYGADVKIVGGKYPDNPADKTRNTLNSTFYTRNTM